MKKAFFFSTVLLICFINSSINLGSQDSNYFDVTDQIDSVVTIDNQGVKNKYVYAYNSEHKIVVAENLYWSGSHWDDYMRNIYTYDENGNVSFILVQAYDQFSNIWTNNNLFSYSYNDNMQIAIDLEQHWINDGWENYRRYTFEYNDQAQLISKLYELSNPQPMENYRLYNYFYDENGHLSERIIKSWNYPEGWVRFKRDSLCVESNGRLNKLFRFLPIDDGWEYFNQILYTYDNNSLMTNALVQSWNSFTGLWANDTSYFYSYSNDKLVEEQRKIWNGSEWTDYSRTTKNYNDDGNIVMCWFEYYWNGEWNTDIGALSIFDFYGNKFYFRSGKIDFYYGPLVKLSDTGPIVNDFDLKQNYPNPFNPATSIPYAVGSRQFVSLKVYDVLGREVATIVDEEQAAGNYEVKFDAGNLSSGIYFYTLRAGNFLQTNKKMILLK